MSAVNKEAPNTVPIAARATAATKSVLELLEEDDEFEVFYQ